ncbi:ABC transporter substrate-binding protein [Clostridium sp. SHJSY1]|uniref:ABC transporter substrate-binding protein n=1 Tax=Clostridium sp. SHJSY1 TaxID=2942483 RepID=UPI002875FF3B|nr:ABC transporter substrate-binding protein [Clostridium sp. SHJSY1]MDS0525809.1 ABC transporter substrate-binding protein [Clostridium sp. SHJSY1]
MKKVMKLLVVMISVITITATLAGCTTSKTNQGEQIDTRTVKDQGGTEVQIPNKVTKIADLWHANNQIVLLLGGADKLVATTDNVKKIAWFDKVYPRIKEVKSPLNGNDVQIEELMSLKPDVVLSSTDSQIESARNAGIKAVKVMFQNFDQMRETVKLTAQVIGEDAEKKADEYLKYLDGNISYVSERTKNVLEEKRPKVLHIVDGTDLLKVDGKKSMIDEWINLAGGVNAINTEGNMITITMEDIIKSNPDVIIIGGTSASKGKEAIENDPTWSSLSAVKNNQIYSNPVGTFNWDRYSAEEALQILWAAKTFYPDLFKDLDLVKKTQEFYKQFLDYDLSSDDAQRIISGLDPEK